jgi:thioredoxin 1
MSGRKERFVTQAGVVVTLTETDLDRAVAPAQPLLVDFFAPGCRPCKALAPILEEVAAEYAGRLRVGKVGLDVAPALAARLELKAVPTLIVFAGGEEKKRITGVAGKAQLMGELEEYLA